MGDLLTWQWTLGFNNYGISWAPYKLTRKTKHYGVAQNTKAKAATVKCVYIVHECVYFETCCRSIPSAPPLGALSLSLPLRRIRSVLSTHTHSPTFMLRCSLIANARISRLNWIISESWFMTSYPTWKPFVYRSEGELTVRLLHRAQGLDMNYESERVVRTLEVYYRRAQPTNTRNKRESGEYK